MSEFLVLRLIHVLGGIFWVGSGIFSGMFLMPALMKSGPAAGQVMAALQERKLFVVLPIVATLTILSGARLMWITSGGFSASYFSSGTGMTFSGAAVCAIVAFLLSLLIVRPASARATALMSGAAQASPETMAQVQRLRARAGSVSVVVYWLLIASAAGMAVARYV